MENFPNNQIDVEIEIIYNEDIDKEYEVVFKDSSKIDCLELGTYKFVSRFFIPKNKILGTFIEKELYKTKTDYIKIQLKAKKNKIFMDSLLDCFEFIINKNFEFNFNRDNLISYFYAFSICELFEKRKEVLEKLLLDISDDNIIYFIKVVSTLEDNFLQAYCFWLIKHLINKKFKFDALTYNSYNFNNIIKFSNGTNYRFEEKKLLFSNNDCNLSVDVSFLEKYNIKLQNELNVYFQPNNMFSIGRVLRRKSDNNILTNDYPHYYQLLLENDNTITLYAKRASENSNFVISKNIVNN